MIRDNAQPSKTREVFGANLRELTANAQSVSQVCRELKINRTQFNRYLTGESFPRPDVLKQICDYFEVDARILLQPLEEIHVSEKHRVRQLTVAAAMARFQSMHVDEDVLPSGNYLLYRHCYFDTERIATTLINVKRTEEGFAELTGFLPRKGAARLGLGEEGRVRRMSGNVFQLPTGFAFLMTLNKVPTWQFGMMSRYYLGNPGLYNGMSVSTHNPIRSFPVLIERLGDDLQSMLAIRNRLTSLHPNECPHFVRSFFKAAQYG